MWDKPSYRLLILLMSLMKVGEIRAQCERPIRENMVLTEASDQPSFPEGVTVTFKCATGYQPVQGSGSRSITCSGNQWTNLELQCQKKSCGSPGSIDHGQYLTPNGIVFGATATAQCNEGYFLVGPKIRRCRDDGWDGRVALCEVVKCSAPPQIQNGEFDPVNEEYNFNDAVTYTCNKGYIVFGDSTVTCSNNGTFQPSPPNCLREGCETPDIKNAKKIEGKSPPYGDQSFVRYKCNEGFKMIGYDYLVCKINKWDQPLPKCIEDTIDPKPDPNPGEVTPAPPEHKTNKDVWIGVGVALAAVLLLIGGGVYYKKTSAGWGKVPTRNEGNTNSLA